MKPFNRRVRASLLDANLQFALDANAKRRITVRQNAFASLPGAEQMRHRAHAVRLEVIDHLDEYLEQFTRNLERNGVIVHRAADAAQAVQIVLEIAHAHGVQRVAKSKTMVSEEIGLNPALEAEGLQVVETDLGEYIVQLRGEPPSHIITPAVHLRRQDVGRLFHEKLGIPLTEDISVMTAAARKVLREVFLSADMGISGVNFGVAETGTLCILTNEGNGRMVTTVPKVHVALMGMERLVPTLDDLALMLALLPRSATGQKITVYANLLHGPRREGEPDGPGERHLVLLDNGRSAVQRSELAEILCCIRCGACLNACPVFREIGGHAYVGKGGGYAVYPGPMGSVVAPALFGQAEFGHLARASSLCGACAEACPVEIDLPRLLLRVRAGQVGRPEERAQAKPNAPWLLSLGLRLFRWAAVSPGRFALAQRLAGWLGRAAPGGWLRLPALTGWGLSKDFPAPARQTFHQRFAVRTASALGQAAPAAAAVAQAEAIPAAPLGIAYSLIGRFEQELAALGGVSVRCSEAELPGRIAALLREKGVQAILAWEDSALPGGLLDGLRLQGVGVVHPRAGNKWEDAQLRAGLTGVIAAAAETGSLLLTGGPGRPLNASLLPELHIAILRQEHLLPGIADLLVHPALRASAAAVLVSGPSRTADIEMTLTIGVHGPGELVVFCI